MSRYINVDEFEKYFDREEWRTPDEKWWPEREIGMVLDDLLSTSDVVEVVRCKDCENWDRHWISSLFFENVHYCAFIDGPCSAGFYCAAAIRRQVLGGDKH